MASTTVLLQTVAITSALTGAGGIACLSLFDVPILKSQPASQALPSIRWLFSRGSHIFPQAAFVSMASYVALAFQAFYNSNPSSALLGTSSSREPIYAILNVLKNTRTVNGYLLAAVLSISIAPVTANLMIPTNFALIKMNEDLGGNRSAKSAEKGGNGKEGGGETRSAEESVDGKGEANQFTDLSGPQGKTERESSAEEDERMRGLLDEFSSLNMLRAVLLAGGGVVGLVTALAA